MGIKTIFKRAMVDFLRWAANGEEAQAEAKVPWSPNNAKLSTGSISSGNIEDGSRGMNFTVYHATGGKVVQIRTYDPRTDRTVSALYIVTDNEDLGEELAQIITRESLTR